MINRRRLIGTVIASAFAPGYISRAAVAQTWPARASRVIVPFPAGSGPDVVARVVGGRLSEMWSAPVVIENKLGAGGNIGSEAVARSNPDGYTMLCNGPAIGLNRYLFNHLSYDPVEDFSPVSLLCTFPNVMTVPNSSPARSVMDFVQLAKERPGGITFAVPGIGTTQHLAGELFKRMAGIEMTAVPYRDASLMNDLYAGRVDVMFGATSLMLSQHRAGRLRAIAVTGAQRFPLASDLPTVAEAGVPGFDVASWFALFLPAKSPPAIVNKINSDVVTALAEPGIQEKFKQLFYLPVSSTPEQLATLLKTEMTKWGAIIREAGITISK